MMHVVETSSNSRGNGVMFDPLQFRLCSVEKNAIDNALSFSHV